MYLEVFGVPQRDVVGVLWVFFKGMWLEVFGEPQRDVVGGIIVPKGV